MGHFREGEELKLMTEREGRMTVEVLDDEFQTDEELLGRKKSTGEEVLIPTEDIKSAERMGDTLGGPLEDV